MVSFSKTLPTDLLSSLIFSQGEANTSQGMADGRRPHPLWSLTVFKVGPPAGLPYPHLLGLGHCPASALCLWI